MQELAEIYRTITRSSRKKCMDSLKHKDNNPVRVITSGCGTAVENLSIFVERCLYPENLKIESRIQDTFEMLNFIDYLNKSNILTKYCILISFDIVNMFPSIDNQSGLEAVKTL